MRPWLNGVLVLALTYTVFFSNMANADIPRWSVLGPSGSAAPVRALVIDPLMPSTIYAAVSNAGLNFSVPVIPEGHGIYKSTDGGASWISSNNGLTNLLVTSLAIDPLTPSTLYAGTDGAGVFKTIDGGNTWMSISTDPTSLEVYSLALDPAIPTTVYVGTEADGIFKSTDGGNTWLHAAAPLADVYSIAVNPQDGSIVYAATNRGVLKSTDSGLDWGSTGAIVSRTARGRSIRTFSLAYVVAVDPFSPSTVYVGMDDQGGVFKSTDGGASWAQAWAGTENVTGTSRYVISLVVDPRDPSVLYIGTDQDAVFKTTNGGARWIPLNANSGHGIDALAIDPQNSGNVYSGTFASNVRKLGTAPMQLDAFHCYPATASTFTAQNLALTDAFQSVAATVSQATTFCAPVNISDQGILDPTASLACYPVSGVAAPQPAPQVFVEHQLESFGNITLAQPDSLCVPSGLNGVPPASDIDHFMCYRPAGSADAFWFSTKAFDVTLSDAVGEQHAWLFRLEHVCVPVDKNGEGIPDPSSHLTCYSIMRRPRGSRASRFRRTTLSLQNEFGDQTVSFVKPKTLCVPSRRD